MRKMGEVLSNSVRYQKRKNVVFNEVRMEEDTKEEDEYRLGLVNMSFQVISTIATQAAIDRTKILDYFANKFPNVFADNVG